MKKAYLVNYSITTRIIAEDNDPDLENTLHDKAYGKITYCDIINEYICPDNMVFEEDMECPHEPDGIDKFEGSTNIDVEILEVEN